MKIGDLHDCPLGGAVYRFRTPDVYDPARLQRFLTRQRVRAVSAMELRVAALAGVARLAEIAGQAEEGARQAAVLEEWFDLAAPIDEDDIDEPDMDLRAAELARQQTEQREARLRLYPQVLAIQANLTRHWADYAELSADQEFHKDVSRIDVVRLLLISISGEDMPRDDDALVTQEAWRAIPAKHRLELADFAFGLFAPTGPQRKN